MESAERARGFIKLWKIFINTLSKCKRNSKELMPPLKWLLKRKTWDSFIYFPKVYNLGKWQLKKQLYLFIWPTFRRRLLFILSMVSALEQLTAK